MDNTGLTVKEILGTYLREMHAITEAQATINRRFEFALSEIDKRLADLEIAVGMVGVEEPLELEHSDAAIELEQKVQLEKMSDDIRQSVVKDVAKAMAADVDEKMMGDLE